MGIKVSDINGIKKLRHDERGKPVYIMMIKGKPYIALDAKTVEAKAKKRR